MDKKITSRLTAQLYNPLILWDGFNYTDKQNEKFAILQGLYEKALQQVSTRNLVMGLEVDFGETDNGNGGFYSAEFIPEFFNGPYSTMRKDYRKDLNFYWPKDYHSNKFMSYLGSINLGEWPAIFHQLTARNIDQWNRLSFYGGRDLEKERFGEFNWWMHLFVSAENDFETSIPDCHIRLEPKIKNDNSLISKIHNEEKEKKRVYSPEEERKIIKEWQETETVKTQICAPAKFFKKIRPRFYFDGTANFEKQRDTEKGIFAYNDLGDVRCYGAPQSQQEPKRYLSPENYFSRALTPMFSFSDDDCDMTHQFYADASIMDYISHKRTYCKLDSSCT